MRFLKVGAVVFGALVITTLGISATDSLSGSSGSLLGLLATTKEVPGACPPEMVHVPTAASFTCVDRFEASPSEACPIQQPTSLQDTQANLNESQCVIGSIANVVPWTYVTREQAATLCARADKRLPTAAEWYAVAIGTPDNGSACNTSQGSLWTTGESSACIAATGIYDAVGNAWEWVRDDVRDGSVNDKPLPEEGYVTQVDESGIPSVTAEQAEPLFYSDYFWSERTGVYGMLRGGYYGSRDDGGVYAVQAKTAPTNATVAIGFRCVR